MKLVPLMVSVKAALPVTADDGLRLVIAEVGGVTPSAAWEETPPAAATGTLVAGTAAT